MHDFSASALHKVKHGDGETPRTVNLAKDATVSVGDDGVHLAQETTVAKHGTVNVDRPPREDAAETFVLLIARAKTLSATSCEENKYEMLTST